MNPSRECIAGVSTVAVVEEMASAQLACIEDGACLEPLAAAELMQAEPEVSEEDTLEADADEAAGEDEDEIPQTEAEENSLAAADETPEDEEENS